MKIDHLPYIHTVYVVGPEDGHKSGLMLAKKVQVLKNGVGGALEPVRTIPHLRGNDRYEVGMHYSRENPVFTYIFD
jgi:hypothetical protein